MGQIYGNSMIQHYMIQFMVIHGYSNVARTLISGLPQSGFVLNKYFSYSTTSHLLMIQMNV